MYKAIVYLNEFQNVGGKHTNNFDIEFDHFEDIASILNNYKVSPSDITIIDFR